jgi:preprotein translocase subunit YajC
MNILVHLAELVVLQAEGGNEQPFWFSMAPLVLMFVVIYFLLIRPASKQRKEHAALLNQLKKDDEVVTNGGIYGKIVNLDERVVTLEVADKVKIKILRDRIAGRWAPAQAVEKK